MCGMTNDACMAQTTKTTKACCPICADDDTHPSAERDRVLTCAEWGAIHGGPVEPKEPVDDQQ
jgi:hypothetical protein